MRAGNLPLGGGRPRRAPPGLGLRPRRGSTLLRRVAPPGITFRLMSAVGDDSPLHSGTHHAYYRGMAQIGVGDARLRRSWVRPNSKRVQEGLLHHISATARTAARRDRRGATSRAVAEAAPPGTAGITRTTDWRDLIAERADRPLRQRRPQLAGTRSRRSPPRWRAKHVVCEEGRSGATRTRATTSGRQGRGNGREAHVRVQLPLRFRPCASRARDDRGGRARRDTPLPRPVSPGIGGDDVSLDTWRFHPDEAGSGALGDLMNARRRSRRGFLNGEIDTVSGFAHTFLPGRTVDDAVEAAVRVRQRLGRHARGDAPSRTAARNAFPVGDQRHEGAHSRSTWSGPERAAGPSAKTATAPRGFKTVLVSETDHPFWKYWWAAPATSSGGATRSCTSCTTCCGQSPRTPTSRPYGADFEDGYRASEVCDAIVRSGVSGNARDHHVSRRETLDVARGSSVSVCIPCSVTTTVSEWRNPPSSESYRARLDREDHARLEDGCGPRVSREGRLVVCATRCRDPCGWRQYGSRSFLLEVAHDGAVDVCARRAGPDCGETPPPAPRRRGRTARVAHPFGGPMTMPRSSSAFVAPDRGGSSPSRACHRPWNSIALRRQRAPHPLRVPICPR